jgi:hypothetical protein
MANTGHDHGAFAFVQLSGGDWDADALADDGIATSDIITVDKKSAIIVGMAFAEDDTGAVVANSVTVAILGTFNDTLFEDAPGLAGVQIGNPMKFKITPVQNDTVYIQFSIDPRDYNLCKICVVNESGQELAVSCKYKTADIPVAS